MVKQGSAGQPAGGEPPATIRCGGAARVSHSGDQIDGGARLRDAGSDPHRLVVVAGLGVAGNDAGDEFGGGRSSGELGLVARGH